jgi:hypothetical protein
MAIGFDDVDLYEAFQDFGKVCQSVDDCREFGQRGCPVQYGKSCANQCVLDDVTYVKKGKEDMPQTPALGCFDEQEALKSIGHLLIQCKTCRQNHNDDCIISVLRNYLEQILFGECLSYGGIPLEYIVTISERSEEMANVIVEEYRQDKGESVRDGNGEN